ncbi:hypothetical protein ACI2KR_07295 [Pseudomonas luteola]
MNNTLQKAPESKQVQRFMALKERERIANENIIRIKTQLVSAEKELAEISEESVRLFNTSDVDELKELYRTTHAKNEAALNLLEETVSDTESIIQDIVSQMEALK